MDTAKKYDINEIKSNVEPAVKKIVITNKMKTG